MTRAIPPATAVLAAVLLSACMSAGPIGPVGPVSGAYDPVGAGPLAPVPPAGPPLAPQAAAHNFAQVVRRVEPVAEAACLASLPGGPCDIQIVVDTSPGQPANAFQTRDNAGQPVIVFTLALIADARNADELAFVMGHEAAHHILAHIPRQEQTAMVGAAVSGVLAAALGGDPTAIRAAQELGAGVSARAYSKDYELEADELGTVLAWRAGYDPVHGAEFFARLPDPGDSFLGTHPPNAARMGVVRQTAAALAGGT